MGEKASRLRSVGHRLGLLVLGLLSRGGRPCEAVLLQNAGEGAQRAQLYDRVDVVGLLAARVVCEVRLQETYGCSHAIIVAVPIEGPACGPAAGWAAGAAPT